MGANMGDKTHVVSGLKARAMPVATKLPQKMYMGHSQPSGSGFSPGLMPQSQPVGGSNCWPPPPPCRRVVREKFLVALVEVVADWRTQRTERRGAAACRMRAMVMVARCAARDVRIGVRGLGQWLCWRPAEMGDVGGCR